MMTGAWTRVALWMCSLSFCVPAAAFAQADVRDQQNEQRTNGTKAESTFVNRMRDRYERISATGLTFKLGSITSGASLSVGADFRRDAVLGTPAGFAIGGFWSIRGYQMYTAEVGRIRGNRQRIELRPADADVTSTFSDRVSPQAGTSLYLDAHWQTFPRVDFFGLGQDTVVDGRSDFELSGSSIDMVGQWQHGPHVGMSVRAGVLNLRVGPGTNRGFEDTTLRYAAEAAPGIDHQDAYVTAGLGVVFDHRDNVYLPAAGTFAGVALWHASSLEATSTGFTRLVADVRHFVAIAGPDHVLALRGLVSTRVGDASDPTPFYLQPTLGGSKTLRGFGSYRLRGDAVWTGSVEYRWHAQKWIEVAPFIDIGAVGDRFGVLTETSAAVTPGIGLRARTEKRVVGRMDYAKGRDGQRIVFTLSAPF